MLIRPGAPAFAESLAENANDQREGADRSARKRSHIDHGRSEVPPSEPLKERPDAGNDRELAELHPDIEAKQRLHQLCARELLFEQYAREAELHAWPEPLSGTFPIWAQPKPSKDATANATFPANACTWKPASQKNGPMW